MANRPTTYGQIKTSVQVRANRNDADFIKFLDEFVDVPHVRIQEIVGPLADLTNDTDSNYYTLYFPYTYIWGALVEAAAFMKDPEAMAYYQGRYDRELQKLMMTGYDALKMRPSGQVV